MLIGMKPVRKTAGLTDVRWHEFTATFASVGAAAAWAFLSSVRLLRRSTQGFCTGLRFGGDWWSSLLGCVWNNGHFETLTALCAINGPSHTPRS